MAATSRPVTERDADPPEEVARHQRAIEALAEISRRCTIASDLSVILPLAVDLIGQSFGGCCGLFLLQPGASTLTLVASFRPAPVGSETDSDGALTGPPRLGQGLIGQVVSSGQSALIQGTAAAEPGLRDLGPARSWLAVPLHDGRRLRGVLVLGLRTGQLDEHDLALCEAIVNQVAVAMARRQIASDQHRDEVLHTVAAALAPEAGCVPDVGKVTSRLAEVIHQHFAGAAVVVYLIDRQREELVPRGWAQGPAVPSPLSRSLRRDPIGQAVEHGEEMMGPDLAAVSGVERQDGACLLMPIPGDGLPRGAIVVTSERRRVFDAADRDLLRSVARQAAVAIENAALHERLAESAATFRDLVERSPDPFFVLGLDGRLLVVNEAMCDLTGYSAPELLRGRFPDLLLPQERELVMTALARLLVQRRGGECLEWTIRCAGGRQRTVEVRIRVLTERGRPIGAQCVGRDITTRRGERLALERQITELRTLHAVGLALANTLEPQEIQHALLAALHAAIRCDDAALYTFANDGALTLARALPAAADLPAALPHQAAPLDWSLAHGQSLLLNDVTGAALDVPVPAFSATRHLLIVPLLAGGRTRGCAMLRRLDGVPFSLEDLRLVESIVAQAALSLHNADLHAETMHAAADLRAVLESIEQGVLVTDRLGRIRFANHRLGDLLTLDVAAIVGCAVHDVVKESLLPRLREPEVFTARLEQLVASPEEIVTDEVSLAVPVARTLERYSGPMRDPVSGAIIGRIEVYTDVSEERRLDRAKDEFLATASHELKTPITTLGGYLELLKRQVERPNGPDPERLTRYVSTAHSELERLRRLSEDLLEVARIGAGRLTLRPTPGDLAATVRETVERFVRRPGLQQRDHQLICHAAEPLPATYDPLRIGQVLNNLLDNALKYSPDGGEVVVEARRVGADAVISVRDAGIGVPPGERERLFQPFYRAENASAGSPEGLGLGLSISRGIVEEHGGRLWVEAAPDRGSLFLLALPLNQPAAS